MEPTADELAYYKCEIIVELRSKVLNLKADKKDIQYAQSIADRRLAIVFYETGIKLPPMTVGLNSLDYTSLIVAWSHEPVAKDLYKP